MSIRKIMCACGVGLGSSFLVEMNVTKVLKKLGLPDIEVTHSAATDVYKGAADVFIIGKDMYDLCSPYGDTIVLDNIVSLVELEQKLTTYLKDKGVI